MQRVSLMTAGLVLVTAAIYWPVHHYGFVSYDDPIYISQNSAVQAGFTAQSIRTAFFTFKNGNWNPLLWISFYIDRQIFNLNPGPMHIENVALHLTAGLLLWRLLFVATAQLDRSFCVTALFLCHPMHVESVAWLSERKDVLSTVWLMAAMLAYVHFIRKASDNNRWIYYAAMLICFVLSLMAKPMGMTLPGILLLMDYWPLQRWPTKSWLNLIIEKLPCLAVAGAGAILAAIAQVHSRATTTLQQLGLFDRAGNAMIGYWLYIIKLAVPIKLAAIYPLSDSPQPAAVIAAGALLVIVTVALYRVRRHKPYLIVGWFWFLGTLLPVIGLLQVGSTAMADRYSYLPSIGLFIAVVWFVRQWWSQVIANAALAVILILFSVLARWQVTYWQDSKTLYAHAVEVIDHNPVAHIGLARVAYDRNDLHTAVDEFNLALRDGPNEKAYYGLGNCWLREDLPKAMGYYREAVHIQPASAEARIFLAAALEQQGNLDEAEQQVRFALSLQPENELAQTGLADILAKRSRL